MEKLLKKYMRCSDADSYDLFQKIVEDMPGGFFIYLAEGDEQILYINRTAISMFGCSSFEEFKELTGGTFHGMVHPDDIDEVEKTISEQINAGSGYYDYVEYRIKRRDGSIRWIADYGHFVDMDFSDNVFLVFIADATDIKQKRMAPYENINNELIRRAARERRYRQAIQHDAVFFFEASLTENRLLSNVTSMRSKSVFNILKKLNIGEGTEFTEFSEGCSKQICQEDAEGFSHFFDRNRLIECMNNEEPEQTSDFKVPDIYGTVHLLNFAVLLAKDIDGNVSALVMAKDITEQARQNRILEASVRQAQSANIAKSTFLASMSHDIRTPLNAILGFTDLIRIKLNGSANEKLILEYLDKINASGTELLSIIDESLEVTRIESGKAVLAEAECDLNDIIAAVEKSIASKMKAKKIEFTVDKTKAKHFQVYADMTRLQEIFRQILDNAAKYTEENGKVKLSVSEKSSSNEYAEYLFSISDTGIGISDEFMPLLYEPFARANTTTSSGVLGCGLGMTIVKNFVDLMGGTLAVKSKLGEGTTFTVSVVLKLAENAVSPNTNADEDEISLEGMRTLLVEDNELNREIAQELLEEAGIKVETAEDGEQSLEILKNFASGYFNFILMDIQMPRMNGYDATRAIRALDDPVLRNIPIIALSANTYSEDIKRSIEAGMDAHAPKPLNMRLLLSMIKKVLKNKGTF